MANPFEPDAIEICMGPRVIERFPYPIGSYMSSGAYLAHTQGALRIYWRRTGNALHMMHPHLKSYPDNTRVVAQDGSKLCNWSVDDELRLPAESQ